MVESVVALVVSIDLQVVTSSKVVETTKVEASFVLAIYLQAYLDLASYSKAAKEPLASNDPKVVVDLEKIFAVVPFEAVIENR